MSEVYLFSNKRHFGGQFPKSGFRVNSQQQLKCSDTLEGQKRFFNAAREEALPKARVLRWFDMGAIRACARYSRAESTVAITVDAIIYPFSGHGESRGISDIRCNRNGTIFYLRNLRVFMRYRKRKNRSFQRLGIKREKLFL